MIYRWTVYRNGHFCQFKILWPKSARLDNNFVRFLAGICRLWYWAGVKAKTPFFGMFTRLTQGQWGEFLWGDPGQDLWSEITLIMSTGGRKWLLERQEISWPMRNLTLPKDMTANKRGCVPNYALWQGLCTQYMHRNHTKLQTSFQFVD